MEEKITLAVTDDHKLMRQTIIKFLTDMGFDVLIEASNANDLIQQLKDSKRMPHVCLLDYNMPGMKGYELAAVLRKEYPEIKLAAFTSNASFSCLVDMIGNGCKAYFIKNSDPKE